MFAFVHVCSRLLAFACVFASAFACVCPAFVCVCSRLLAFAYAPLCCTPPLRDTDKPKKVRFANRGRSPELVQEAPLIVNFIQKPLREGIPELVQGRKKQHKHRLFGPDFLRIFLTLTPGCPGGQKVSPHHRGRRKTHFLVRTSTIFSADVHDPKGRGKTLYKKSLR